MLEAPVWGREYVTVQPEREIPALGDAEQAFSSHVGKDALFDRLNSRYPVQVASLSILAEPWCPDETWIHVSCSEARLMTLS